jgi:hypothetical protein
LTGDVPRLGSGVPSLKADPALSPTASTIVVPSTRPMPPVSVTPTVYVRSGGTLPLYGPPDVLEFAMR